MSAHLMTINRGLFISLLSHAPEALQREAKENARRAIPALCFTEDDIRQQLLQEEGWKELSHDEQQDAVERLFDRSEYDRLGTAANLAIAEAAMNYVADTLLEKAERLVGTELT